MEVEQVRSVKTKRAKLAPSANSLENEDGHMAWDLFHGQTGVLPTVCPELSNVLGGRSHQPLQLVSP